MLVNEDSPHRIGSERWVGLPPYRRGRRSRLPVGRLFPGWSISHFPELLSVVGEALPSLGVRSILPYTLIHFGFACGDPKHPACDDLVYNFEREWAWTLCNAFMSEVSQHGRAFIQAVGMLSCLSRVAPLLPDVPLHPLQDGPPHVPWFYISILDLMHRVGAVPECNRHLWTNYTIGSQSLFLPYDFEGDFFVARPNSPVVGPSRNKGGVRSTAREARRKLYRDLEGEPPAIALAGVDAVCALLEAGPNTAAGATLPPLPSLGSVVCPGPQHTTSLSLGLAHGVLAVTPRFSNAVESLTDRTWAVEGLPPTLKSWYLEHRSEVRSIGAER